MASQKISLHDADARHHGRAYVRRLEASFDRGLPLRELLFGRRKLLDVSRRVLKGDELAAARKQDRFVERSFPAAISRHAAA
jgi:hypothetical protein